MMCFKKESLTSSSRKRQMHPITKRVSNAILSSPDQNPFSKMKMPKNRITKLAGRNRDGQKDPSKTTAQEITHKTILPTPRAASHFSLASISWSVAYFIVKKPYPNVVAKKNKTPSLYR